MREQSATGLGLTVSRRFSTRAQADDAAKQLRSAGFRDEDIRIWQHKRLALHSEDRLARTVEGLLAGGVIGGLLGLLLTTAFTWDQGERIVEETSLAVAVAAAAIGAIITAIAVNIVSTRVAFSHPHHVEPDEPPSIVTVRAGDKEEEARRVLGTAPAVAH